MPDDTDNDPEDDIPLATLMTNITPNPLTEVTIDNILPTEDDSDDWEDSLVRQYTKTLHLTKTQTQRPQISPTCK